MPNSDYIYEQIFELRPTGLSRNRECPTLEVDLSGLHHRVSKSDGVFRERTAPIATLATKGGREKRSEPRFATSDSALLQILNPFSDKSWYGHVLDVSKHGLGLWMPTSLMPGSDVKVRMKNYVAFGNARYCIVTIERFLVGIQLHEQIPCRMLPERVRAEDHPGERE
jgi:hypothetical protein